MTMQTAVVPWDRMGRCARLAWEHAVEARASAAPERQRLGVMTGHILLGVLEEPTCAGGLVLRKMGLDLEHARDITRFVLFYGHRRDGEEEPLGEWMDQPHTPAALKVIEYSLEEAALFSPTYPIGTEHLLLGVLRASLGMGNGIMAHFGINQHQARAARDTFWDVLKLTE
jgi:ATP-dependent Clp protease ATP-binding subunit ClpA